MSRRRRGRAHRRGRMEAHRGFPREGPPAQPSRPGRDDIGPPASPGAPCAGAGSCRPGSTARPIQLSPPGQIFDKGSEGSKPARRRRTTTSTETLKHDRGRAPPGDDIITHRLPLSRAPKGYEIFNKKLDDRVDGRPQALTESADRPLRRSSGAPSRALCPSNTAITAPRPAGDAPPADPAPGAALALGRRERANHGPPRALDARHRRQGHAAAVLRRLIDHVCSNRAWRLLLGPTPRRAPRSACLATHDGL